MPIKPLVNLCTIYCNPIFGQNGMGIHQRFYADAGQSLGISLPHVPIGLRIQLQPMLMVAVSIIDGILFDQLRQQCHGRLHGRVLLGCQYVTCYQHEVRALPADSRKQRLIVFSILFIM